MAGSPELQCGYTARSASAGTGRHGGVSGTLELYSLGMQVVDPPVELVEAATVALHALTEAGHHSAEIGDRAPPGGHRLALAGDRRIQIEQRPAQPLVRLFVV